MPRGVDRVDEAIGQNRLWRPNELRAKGKLALWFDFSDPNSFTGDSGKIVTLRDLSGKGRTGTQATAGTRFAWEPTSIHGAGRGMAYWDAATEYFINFSPALTYNGTNGVSWAGVASFTSGTSAIVGGAGTGGHELRHDGGTTNSAPLLTPMIFGSDAATNLSAVHTNGTRTGTSTNPGVSNGGDYIGTAAGGEHMRGRCGEILASELLWSTGDRELIDGYLAWKWSLTNKLPGTHPYKNRPPLIGD
jgi:hypothetical protein